MKDIFLQWQLRRQGASKQEARDLSGFAGKLPVVPGLSAEAKQRIAAEVGFKQHHGIAAHPRFAIAGAAFAIFTVLIVVAQGAQPGSTLYALKRGTEEVRLVVQPGFTQEDVRQRREAEQRKAAEAEHSETEKDSPVQNTSGSQSGKSKIEDTLKQSGSDDSKKSGSQSSGSSNSGSGSSSSSGSNSSSSSSGSSPNSGSTSTSGKDKVEDTSGSSGSSGGSGSSSDSGSGDTTDLRHSGGSDDN